MVFSWPTLRGERNILVVAAMAVLFAVCGFAQTASTLPDQTERRIDSILNQMTIEEKIDLLGGVDGFYLRCPQARRAPLQDGRRTSGSTQRRACHNYVRWDSSCGNLES